MVIKKQVFRSRITQRETSRPHSFAEIDLSMGLLPLRVSHFKLSVYCDDSVRNVVYGIPRLVTQTKTTVNVNLFKEPGSQRWIRWYANHLTHEHLSPMGIPKDEQLFIIARLFELVEDEYLPWKPITLVMVDVTVRPTPALSSHGSQVMIKEAVSLCASQVMIDEATWELMGRYNIDEDTLTFLCDPILMKNMDFVSLRDPYQNVRRMPCFLCKENPDHKAIRLRCSHLYHKSCIFKWLGSCHMCPSCRRPIANEPPEYSGKQHQDELLAMWRNEQGDTSLEEGIMECRFWRAELRKKISNYGGFLFLFFYFLLSVFVGYRL